MPNLGEVQKGIEITRFEMALKKQQSEIDELKKQVKLLKWQIRETQEMDKCSKLD